MSNGCIVEVGGAHAMVSTKVLTSTSLEEAMEHENSLSFNGSMPLHVLVKSLSFAQPLIAWHPMNVGTRYLNAKLLLVSTIFIEQLQMIKAAFANMKQFSLVTPLRPWKGWNWPTTNLQSYSVSHPLFTNGHEMVVVNPILEEAANSTKANPEQMFVWLCAPIILKQDNGHFTHINFTLVLNNQIK
ncbi:hypothetical protein BS47DRAFT_1369674 [Hydnum rufescens UP504]|uniref:Uncharacterized protein n=1 Tax=Hydnum rufescens UP504 TaxID=1448309 RepID=A0A9P6AE25_9AGAM|nr:hypothetical protein BS47DRAFT_1369674 [Hydnum rufescens UP504]